jgi:hypothetical protein
MNEVLAQFDLSDFEIKPAPAGAVVSQEMRIRQLEQRVEELTRDVESLGERLSHGNGAVQQNAPDAQHFCRICKIYVTIKSKVRHMSTKNHLVVLRKTGAVCLCEKTTSAVGSMCMNCGCTVAQ